MNYDGDQYDAAQYDEQTRTDAQYLEGTGQYDGGPYDGDAASGRRWVIGNQTIRVVGVSLTPTQCTLDVVARAASERRLLRSLDDNAGAYETRERADGTTIARDTAGGSNTFTVRPSARLRPPRIERQWLVDDVSRERTSADTTATRATVSLVGRGTRESVAGYNDADVATWWEFDFAGGTIITPRVANISQGATTTVTLTLSARQAELAETVPAAVAGATTQSVPDGDTFASDTTPDSRQTVTISPPDDATDPAIDAGDYVIDGFESIGTTGEGLRLTLELSSRYEVGA